MITDFKKYLAWAGIQQVTMGIIFENWKMILPVWVAVILTAMIFMACHIPNKFLMAVCLPVECLFLFMWKSPVSLFWIIPSHALLAIAIKRYVPESVTHGMKVLWEYEK